MSGLFNKGLVKTLNGKEVLAFKDPNSGKILNVETSVLLGQIFDLDKLGNRCLTYPVSFTTDCQTQEQIQKPLQISDVLDVFEKAICENSNIQNETVITSNQALDYGIIYRPDLGDLTYEIWATKYKINNVVYDNQPINQIVTLNVGDENNPRFDLFVIFNDGQGGVGAKVIQGTPDANPQVPQLENSIQVEVGLKLMNPNQTTDLEYSRETVWDENLGYSDEWLLGSGSNISVITSAENSFKGNNFVRFGSVVGVTKSFTLQRENLKEFNIKNSLVIGIKNLSGSFNSGERIQIRLTNISSPVRIVPAILDITNQNASSFNLDPNSDQWQYAYIPFSLLNYEAIEYDLITIDSNLNSELWIDDVHIETGTPTTIPQNTNPDYRLSKTNGSINLLRNNSIVSSVKISEVELIVGALNQTVIPFQENTDYVPNNIDLFIDGVLQTPTSDYNYSNNQITLNEPLLGASNIYIRKF